MPFRFPGDGAALRREWVADHAQVYCTSLRPSAVLLDSADSCELAGLLLAALRLDLPAVVAAPHHTPFSVALAAAGLAPLSAHPLSVEKDALASPRVAVEMVRSGGPRPKDFLDSFSLANALRAGLAVGGGPEFLVHLAAVAREAGEAGFSRMMRVLAPESPTLVSLPKTTADLLASLGDGLHDVWTVEGKMLRENLPHPPGEVLAEKHRLRFVTGRASGVEAVVGVPSGVEEIAGVCCVRGSEDEAIDAVAEGRVEDGNLLVVVGCGVRGAPGLLSLHFLEAALREARLDVPVLTDGLPPSKPSVSSPWISLFTPEAAAGGVIGRLRDGDSLRFDLSEGLIRTGVRADEILSREPLVASTPSGFGYAARYARAALPALEGAGFG